MTVAEQIKWLERLQDCSGNEEVKSKFQFVIDTLNTHSTIKRKLIKATPDIDFSVNIGKTGAIQSEW